MFAFGFSAEGLLKLPFFLKNISKSFLKTLDISPECLNIKKLILYGTFPLGTACIPLSKRLPMRYMITACLALASMPASFQAFLNNFL